MPLGVIDRAQGRDLAGRASSIDTYELSTELENTWVLRDHEATLLGALTILAVMIVASVAALLSPRLRERSVLRPYLIARGSDYWRLLTSGFVHADIPHLIFNLITFYSFAFTLEHVIGTPRFISLYFCGLLTSAIGTCIKHRNEPNYASLGASGAILAVLFASIIYFPRSRLLILPLPIPVSAPLFAVLYLAWSYYASRNSRDGVNHDAHIAGALTGVAFVALTDPQTFLSLLRHLAG